MKHRKHDNSWYEEIWTNQFRWLQSDHSKQVIDSHWSTKSAGILYQDYHDSRLKTWCFLFIALTSKFCSRIWKHVVSWFSQLSGLVVLDTYCHCFNITRSRNDVLLQSFNMLEICFERKHRAQMPVRKKAPSLSTDTAPLDSFSSFRVLTIEFHWPPRKMWKYALSIFEF